MVLAGGGCCAIRSVSRCVKHVSGVALYAQRLFCVSWPSPVPMTCWLSPSFSQDFHPFVRVASLVVRVLGWVFRRSVRR